MDKRYEEVAAVLDRYYDGLYRCDTDALAEVFHQQAQYFTDTGEELLHYDMAAYFPIVRARRSPESNGEARGYEIDAITFAGPGTANARMRSSMLGNDYTDYLSLLRLDGAWKIVSKVFHAEPQR